MINERDIVIGRFYARESFTLSRHLLLTSKILKVSGMKTRRIYISTRPNKKDWVLYSEDTENKSPIDE